MSSRVQYCVACSGGHSGYRDSLAADIALPLRLIPQDNGLSVCRSTTAFAGSNWAVAFAHLSRRRIETASISVEIDAGLASLAAGRITVTSVSPSRRDSRALLPSIAPAGLPVLLRAIVVPPGSFRRSEFGVLIRAAASGNLAVLCEIAATRLQTLTRNMKREASSLDDINDTYDREIRPTIEIAPQKLVLTRNP